VHQAKTTSCSLEVVSRFGSSEGKLRIDWNGTLRRIGNWDITIVVDAPSRSVEGSEVRHFNDFDRVRGSVILNREERGAERGAPRGVVVIGITEAILPR
jgi:hypothetical protein